MQSANMAYNQPIWHAISQYGIQPANMAYNQPFRDGKFDFFNVALLWYIHYIVVVHKSSLILLPQSCMIFYICFNFAARCFSWTFSFVVGVINFVIVTPRTERIACILCMHLGACRFFTHLTVLMHPKKWILWNCIQLHFIFLAPTRMGSHWELLWKITLSHIA